MKQLIPVAPVRQLPRHVVGAGDDARLRFLEFSAASIRDARAEPIGSKLSGSEPRGRSPIQEQHKADAR